MIPSRRSSSYFWRSLMRRRHDRLTINATHHHHSIILRTGITVVKAPPPSQASPTQHHHHHPSSNRNNKMNKDRTQDEEERISSRDDNQSTSPTTDATAATTTVTRQSSSFLSKEKHRTHILGAGAVGLFLACKLRLAYPSFPLHALVRQRQQQQQQQQQQSEHQPTTTTEETEKAVFPSSNTSRTEHSIMAIRRRKRIAQTKDKNRVMISFQHNDDSKTRVQTIAIPTETISSSSHDTDIRSSTSTTITRNQRRIRNLIVTTKAFSAVDAILSVQERFRLDNQQDDTTNNQPQEQQLPQEQDATDILLLCNGALAVRDELLRHPRLFPQRQRPGAAPKVHLGFTTHGVIREATTKRDSDNGNGSIDTTDAGDGDRNSDADDDIVRIWHTGVGHIQLPTTWGDDDHPLDWTRLWNQAGLHCLPPASNDEMEQLLWLKLAANCVINPLTALHQCTNGALPDVVPNFETLQRDILTELAAVAQTACSANAADRLTTQAMTAFVTQVIADTQENKSSMLQDVLQGRPTEIEYLTGYVVQKGAEFGVDTPVNARILGEMRDL